MVLSSTPRATVTPPTSILTTPTNISAVNANIGSLGTIIGATIVAVILLVTIILSIAIIGAAVCVKIRKNRSNDSDPNVTQNEAYGAEVQGVTVYRESVVYDYPSALIINSI